MNRAFFVRYPRRIGDMQMPHLISDDRAYEVVGEIVLAAMDYENFVTDMRADRLFIEENAGLCSEGETLKCLLVRRRGGADGVLVTPDGPDNPAHVKWAAYAK